MPRTDTAGEDGGRTAGGAQTVERAFEILRSFKTTSGPLGVTEIARRLDLNISSVYRMVRAMEQAGFLEQDPATRRYRLGTAVAGLNRVLLHQRRFNLAQPELRWLRDQVGADAGAALAIRDDREALVVGHLPTATGAESWDVQVANAVSLHASAFGKVLLAWSDPSPEELAGLAPFERFTDRTITAPERLHEELTAVRARGYAVANRERFPTQLTVAVPVLDADDHSYLALGIGVTWSRAHAARIATIARRAQESAHRLRDVLLASGPAEPLV